MSEVRQLRPRWAWDGERLWSRPVVSWDGDGRIVAFGASDAVVEEREGLLMPGLLNGHVHLELGSLQTSPGIGLPAWVRELRSRAKVGAAQAGIAVLSAIRLGTAAVVDVGNSGSAAEVAAAAGLPGHYFREILGIDQTELPAVPGTLTPHAPYSTHPRLIAACADRRWTIHFDEDPEEARFLRHGDGPWRDYLLALNRDLSRFSVPRCSPTEYLAGLGVLGPHTILAHATCTRGTDLARLAQTGAAVAICARSNLHITGRLPDVPAMLALGIPLLLGTDSLASVPDLDLLAEAATLAQSFPELPPSLWLTALGATAGRVMGLPLGRLSPGFAPGLLMVQLPPTENPLALLLNGQRWPRRWLACPQS